MIFLLYIKIILLPICGLLNALGGFHWLFCRRFIMPCVIGVAVSLSSGIWWLGLTVLPVIGTLCLGYFSGANWGRGLWTFLQALVMAIGCVLCGHLFVLFYAGYVVLGGILGGIYKNWPQICGDMIEGAYWASFIFLVHR